MKKNRDVTKERNDKLVELENIKAENESITWLRLHHCVLDEYAFPTCKDVHKWADHEGIDGRESVSRKKTFFEICDKKFNE